MKNTQDRTRVCVISSEIVGPHQNGGIGTHSYYLSVFLSRQLGQQVTFVYTGEIERHDEAYWQKWFRKNADIEFVWIAPPSAANYRAGDPTSYVVTSALVYEWLRRREFDVCHFQEMLGNGFRCFEAKRLGLAFQKTLLTCTTHSSWEWINQAMQSWPRSGRTELEAKYMERYCIEHCDVLLSPSRYMLEWVKENDVPIHAPQHVLPYLFDPEIRSVGSRPVNRHIVFFGRLEVRKGILVFLDALRILAKNAPAGGEPVRVTFLGRPGYTPDGNGLDSVEEARPEVAAAFTMEAVTDLDHKEAMAFLAQHNDALVVCPSLVDNSPYAIIECLELGLNIIAARSGGIPELFDGDERLFEPTADALASKLRAGLAGELPPLRKSYGAARSREQWTDFCTRIAPGLNAGNRAPAAGAQPRVDVLVVGSGADTALLDTLKSLDAQTREPATVTIVRDKADSTTDQIDSFCAKRGWKFTGNGSETEADPGLPLIVVRKSENAHASETGAIALIVRRGARLDKDAVARFSLAMSASGVDALSCRGFNAASAGNGTENRPFEPLGPCMEGGILLNTFGEGAFAVRAELLAPVHAATQRLGERTGFWHFLAELAGLGRKVDVLPETLVTFPRQIAALDGSDLDFNSHTGVIDAITARQPDWVRHALVNAVSIQPNGPAASSATAPPPKPRRSIGYKIRRETKRILGKLGIGEPPPRRRRNR